MSKCYSNLSSNGAGIKIKAMRAYWKAKAISRVADELQEDSHRWSACLSASLCSSETGRRGTGYQTIHLGSFMLTLLLSLQHSYFNWIKLNFLKRKLLYVLRQALGHLLHLKSRRNLHRAFYFYFFPSNPDSLGSRTPTTPVLRTHGLRVRENNSDSTPRRRD